MLDGRGASVGLGGGAGGGGCRVHQIGSMIPEWGFGRGRPGSRGDIFADVLM